MASARAMLVLLTAARAFSAYAVAASASPALASKALVGSGVAPAAVVATGGRGRPFQRRLGYGALAALAAAGIYLTLAPGTDEDDDEGDDSTGYGDMVVGDDEAVDHGSWEREISSWVRSSTRPPSAQEVQAMTKMLKRFDRRVKKLMEQQKMKMDDFWFQLEELIKKGKIIISAVELLKEFHALVASTIAGSILLIDKYGDPLQYFVCPFSGYSEVVDIFVYTVTPKVETPLANGTGGTTAPVVFSTHRMKSVSQFGVLKTMGPMVASGYKNLLIDDKCHSNPDLKITLPKFFNPVVTHSGRFMGVRDQTGTGIGAYIHACDGADDIADGKVISVLGIDAASGQAFRKGMMWYKKTMAVCCC